MSKLRRLTGVVVLAAAAVLTLQVGVLAQDVAIEIPLVTVVRGAEGSQHHLASAAVPPGLEDRTCEVVARVENQRSVHPGNDLVITSGTESVVLADVEGESFGSVAGQGELTLGSEVHVVLVLGADGVFSGGLNIEISCPEPPTTSTTSTTTTSIPTTTAPPTTIPVSSTSTSTTMPEITATTPPETTTPTSVLGTSTSTSTTTGPGGTSTSTTVPGTLPFTGGGPDAPVLAAVAAMLGGLGLLIVTASHKPVEDATATETRLPME